MSFWRVLMMGFALASASPVLQAENFITISEAQKLMFPAANAFEQRTLRYSRSNLRTIEAHSKLKMERSGHRFWIARADSNVLGVVFLDQVIGKHDLIDYAVSISLDGKVQAVEILAYRESYGGEIRGAKWRSQFKGKTAKDPLRLNRDIYNLSGATMSCRSVADGVKRLLSVYESLVRPQLSGSNDVSNLSQETAAD